MATGIAAAGAAIGSGGKAKGPNTRNRRLAAQEIEISQAEGRQASPFGNPGLTKRQRAAGEEFKPVKGAVSEGAQKLAESGNRAESRAILDKDLAKRTEMMGKGRGGTVGDKPKKKKQFNMSTFLSPGGNKNILGV